MPTTRQQVQQVLLITLVLNLAVALGKILLGVATGALAIVADGFHSLTDSTGNIAGLIANHFASLPADDDHPYGHRRFETLAALLIGALLMLTALEIGRGALERLQTQTIPETSPLSFAVLFATLIVNIGVSRYQIAQGQRLRSEVLLADAKNTSADVFVTLSVIASAILMSMTRWWWVDIVAALVVMLLIGRAALQIFWQTTRILVDAAPYSPESLTTILQGIPSVLAIQRARSRGTLDAAQLDIDVVVAPEMTAMQTAAITQAIRQRLGEHIEGIAETEVHFVPQPNAHPNAALTARAVADMLGLATHEVQLHGKLLELHVEVPAGQTLEAAHQQVSALEAQMRVNLPEVQAVVTHIEPAIPATEYDSAAMRHPCAEMAAQAQQLLQGQYPQLGWHDIQAHPLAKGFALTLHATLAAQTPVEMAHDLAEQAETFLRGSLPQLQRVTIHTEPFDHN